MKGAWLFIIGAVCGAAGALLPRAAMHLHGTLHEARGGETSAGTARAHTEEKFVFTARAPMERVAPLFGADKERMWSAKWEPSFIYPLPSKDAQGMVFSVAHGHLTSVWVNTEFDLANGRVQYVYVIPEALATVIMLHLTPEGNRTRVQVVYARTALSAKADEHVRQMAEQDRGAGPEWEKAVNEYLEKHKE
ncbi:MAG TPA: hypothetical protein VGF61_14810 [Candidatus Acidoferrum sp.]|jgi:hypothetical protein